MIEYDAVTRRWVVKRGDISVDNGVTLDQVIQELKQSAPTYGEIKARDEGRREVWNMMRRIMLPRREESDAYTVDQVKEAFDVITITDVLKMPLTDALATDKKLMEKIKREREKLHVGDEVEFVGMFDQGKGYVIDVNVEDCPNCVRLLIKGEGSRLVSINFCKKTGKHNPDIVKVMNSL